MEKHADIEVPALSLKGNAGVDLSTLPIWGGRGS